MRQVHGPCATGMVGTFRAPLQLRCVAGHQNIHGHEQWRGARRATVTVPLRVMRLPAKRVTKP
jgi:hypothetical protein